MSERETWCWGEGRRSYPELTGDVRLSVSLSAWPWFRPTPVGCCHSLCRLILVWQDSAVGKLDTSQTLGKPDGRARLHFDCCRCASARLHDKA